MSEEQNYSELSVHDILMNLNPGDKSLCAQLDPHLANKIVDLESTAEVFYYLCYGNAHEVLPQTRDKLNSIFENHIDNNDTLDWWRIEAYKRWLNEGVKKKVLEKWIDSDEHFTWIVEIMSSVGDLAVPALNKLSKCYKKRRSIQNAKAIETLFLSIDGEHVDEACEIVSSATPAISVCLLSRNDVNEKYTLKGLKSLSKLSRQRSIETKIDFSMLGNLGPKARLDAMKQLLGMLDSYYAMKQTDNPFTKTPSRDEVEEFLFPCSLKYNEQVVELMSEFDKLIQDK